MNRDVLARIDAFQHYAVELQRGLVAIPALCPSSGGEGELDKAVWLEKELRKLPFDSIKRIDAPDKRAKGGFRPNIVAIYKGMATKKTFWIMSHIDIVPPGDLAQWASDPYTLRVDGEKLYGRGTEDNHQGLVGSILCVKAFMEAGHRLPFNLGLLFAADEETGSAYGADYLVKHHPELFGSDDVFIVPDAGLPDASLVEVAEKSLLWLKIKTLGKQCHASTPALGRNSFRAASDLVVRLQSLYRTFKKRNRVFEPPISTFEPTKKEPNVPNVNTIPGDDVFYLDCRVLPEYSLDEIKAEITRLSKETEKKYQVAISLEIVQESEAAPPTASDAPVVSALVAAVKKVYKGARPRALGIGGGTVAACFRRLSLPVVVYSKLDEVAHQPNEYCILPNLLGDAKVFALTAMSLG